MMDTKNAAPMMAGARMKKQKVAPTPAAAPTMAAPPEMPPMPMKPPAAMPPKPVPIAHNKLPPNTRHKNGARGMK